MTLQILILSPILEMLTRFAYVCYENKLRKAQDN